MRMMVLQFQFYLQIYMQSLVEAKRGPVAGRTASSPASDSHRTTVSANFKAVFQFSSTTAKTFYSLPLRCKMNSKLFCL